MSAQELAEKLNTTSKELLSWFGDGQRQKKDLKKNFEKYMGDDGMAYIRRAEFARGAQGEHNYSCEHYAQGCA